jgi:MFS family permease
MTMPVVQGSWRRVLLRPGGDHGTPLRFPPAAAGAAGAASAVGFLVVLEFASGILQGWLSPLLPGIVAQYGTTAAEVNWIGAVYLLSAAVCVPLMSKLGDRYGHRRLLIVAAALVAVGSVLVATAPTFGVLLLGRAVQGPLGRSCRWSSPSSASVPASGRAGRSDCWSARWPSAAAWGCCSPASPGST